jgi:hypothetical protein
MKDKAVKHLKDEKFKAKLFETPAAQMVEIYSRRLKNGVRAPLTLGDIWGAVRNCHYLAETGCVFDDERQTVTVNGVPGIRDGHVLTSSRATWGDGNRERVGFLTYGDPDFELLLNHMASWVDHASVRIVRGVRPGTDAPLISISVPAADGGTRCLQDWRDVAPLHGEAEADPAPAPARVTDFEANRRVLGNHKKAWDNHRRSVAAILMAELAGRLAEKPAEIRKALRDIKCRRAVRLPDKASECTVADGPLGETAIGAGGGYIVRIPRSGHRVLAAAMGRLILKKGKQDLSVDTVVRKLRVAGSLDYPPPWGADLIAAGSQRPPTAS